MSREIPDAPTVQGDFAPLVGLREVGSFVKGKVTEVGSTNNKNPVITLELINLHEKATTSISLGDKKYKEVEVTIGDLVQVIGSTKRLQEKLPQLTVGDIVTITYKGETSLKQGWARKEYSVIIH